MEQKRKRTSGCNKTIVEKISNEESVVVKRCTYRSYHNPMEALMQSLTQIAIVVAMKEAYFSFIRPELVKLYLAIS
ncbi:MAG: hypothetical protein LBD57_03430 [Endomicrobium sp.]|uniref:hypothetical protein n=1 Tax=Candidatus Endomicrobiellum cubanum TaxID=3242325 RepID=UPI00282A0ADD|nr:hypothetical protein [Endomicrobium sp.]